ncbi:Endoribonuclease dicer-like protein [Thalictrum thalictroides]|uniref:Endoribonuclease dicer-like protein n=1 Tax=Thalictrum thalictroides TaxID=46969 RepID=A0A7J6V837_THATH|nr:Endoribonuclease dicer-like protein [Thalictrum thalictroides]
MSSNQIDIDPQNFARSYQIDALEKAMKQNTIVFLETGSGKTLIAIMLIRSYAYQLRKPSSFVAVFLVPTVHLVNQQSEVVKLHTDLKVGKYWGELGVDFWDANTWKNELAKYEVLVMTPQILLDALRHGFFKLDIIKLLIFDECHNARGNSAYACILKEFYHVQLRSTPTHLPRIFGMTACLVKSKGIISSDAFGKQILEFENLMNSKVYTVTKESVLAEFIPFSTPKVKLYNHVELPNGMSMKLENQLLTLKRKCVESLKEQNLNVASVDSAVKNVSRLCENFMFCVRDLGVWFAYQAAKLLSCNETFTYFWENNAGDAGEGIIKNFSLAAFGVFSLYIPSGPKWCIGDDLMANLDAGLLTARVNCLVQSLMEYREKKDLRCIVFVERVITAIALQSFLSEVLISMGWTVTYMAGSRSGLHSQRRNEQFDIIDSFRKGVVNIIIATQILEEGLDVQRCNLVVRFDPSKTVCSFIQSRGRARMEGSDYILMVRSGDASEFSRVKNYLSSGNVMREESLRYSSLPCAPPKSGMYSEEFYRVETTGALVSLSSSVALIYYYCSQLPSDGYFRPTPRFTFYDDSMVCTLHLPTSCPLQTVRHEGPNKDMLKKLVCLEACRKLHEIGALTDYLLPESVKDEVNECHSGGICIEEKHINYFPGELVFDLQPHFDKLYRWHCYTIVMKQNFDYDVRFKNVILLVKCDLGNDFSHTEFELLVNRGSVIVNIAYAGIIHLNPEQVSMGTKFQVTVLRLLIDHSLNKLADSMESLKQHEIFPSVKYLLLPSMDSNRKPPNIDWNCVSSLIFPTSADYSTETTQNNCHETCCPDRSYDHYVHTKDQVLCRCMLMNSLVFTPHNGYMYCITGFLDGTNGSSIMKSKGEVLTYKKYYHSKHGINLQYEEQSLLSGRHIFTAHNCLRKQQYKHEKESITGNVELPPELCIIIMSCISVGTLFSFSLVPSIMHRVESILLAINFKKLQMDHSTSNINIPTMKILEAITTKKCQEDFNLESLETLGDSFLKYAVSQQLFRRNKYHHEGLLSSQKERMVSNNFLYKLGCARKLQGFIRYKCFDPKDWIIPGDLSGFSGLEEVSLLTSGKVYAMGSRHMKSKVVADVVEGLLGAYLITGGELAALFFMDWLGIEVDFVKEVPNDTQLISQPERIVNVNLIESLLNYSFHDPSLLVEALTHGSYQLPEISRCYQRLEFLGDSVLDYLITIYMYAKYPGMSPGQLTDLRSSAVNNDCYALAAVKAGLHKHILHASPLLHVQMKDFVESFEQLSLYSTSGWESETPVPKALGDVIESLAGAVLVDSGYNKETVWKCVRPILEPLATLDTMKLHPVRELDELCRHEAYEKEISVSDIDGKPSVTIEVKVNGISYKDTRCGINKKTAKKLAAKTVLQNLKASMLEDG